MGTANKTRKHIQGCNMLNKITKLVCAGVIIGLSGLCALGNRIDVFYEGGPTLVAEGIDGVELPAELSDPSHDLWDEYDPYVKFVGIRLNLPQELIADCEDNCWQAYNKDLFQKLEEMLTSEDKFHDWCNQQKAPKDNQKRRLCHIYAYVLKVTNQKNYFISGDFCKKITLNDVLYNIRKKNIICCSFLDPNGPREIYLDYLDWAINEIL